MDTTWRKIVRGEDGEERLVTMGYPMERVFRIASWNPYDQTARYIEEMPKP